MDEKPVEVFCPICGYHAALNDPEESMSKLTRAEKVEKIREMQKGDHPYVMCRNCRNPQDSVRILEIR